MRGQDYFNDLLTGGYDYTANPGNGTSTTSNDARTTFGSLSFNSLVLMYAESAGVNDLETIQTWTIFGDPTLQLRSDEPKNITLSNPAVSATTFTTKITSDLIPIEGILVSIYKDNSVFTGYTDQEGDVTIDHTFLEGTPVKVTITGFNIATISQELPIGSSLSNIDENSVESISLEQNYPNPFNPTTSISYSLNSASQVNLTVFNAAGEMVTELVDGSEVSGNHSVSFDGLTLNSGVYFYKLTVNGVSDTKKMVLTK
jgi:hypothetical protein